MKKLLSLFLCICFFVPVLPVSAEAPLELSAKSALLMESSTGKILFEKASHEALPPASVTKIMTMLLVMEALDCGQYTLDDLVPVSAHAASMGGSQVFLEENEQMSVHDMLKAVAVASGNDAAVALAEFTAGSHQGFVDKMNQRAKELGMNDTNFINCNGLDEAGHVTSANDIALMSREIMRHPKIFEYTTIWMDSLRNGSFGLVNTNKLVRFYQGATGLKTGSTSVAGFCISATAKRDNMDLIAVVMGAPTSKERFADATKMLDYGFANYGICSSLVKDDELAPLTVKKGIEDTVEIGLAEGFSLLMEKSKIANMEKTISLPDHVGAPIHKNHKVGYVEFFSEGKSVGKCDIVAKKDIKAENPWGMMKRIASYYFHGK
ncbi:MAG: D-alanyl-D-alanine carboxypeptidase [Clostridia bacterium]|nr:D-alanyl-D-alanine carboxypeptidase [Clostridia bacterium]